MLVTNGKVNRNIAESQFHEYKAKGYKEVKAPEAKTSKPKAKKSKE